ncbi:hypothetical protein RFI_29263 [Reticulomyxa filosa]|uniref:CAP-Gly domain-containing protein n=1 Tax=Reticulomyxa filosa TaxID=46433 RepID=X6M513_RETFI|nr:hypothetical protein RFI_29263 [Reticulomyxa filosa]|eukprot:ETO08125.1 hypothetical protein RFI_29263 [Reticulomyxa filosa]
MMAENSNIRHPIGQSNTNCSKMVMSISIIPAHLPTSKSLFKQQESKYIQYCGLDFGMADVGSSLSLSDFMFLLSMSLIKLLESYLEPACKGLCTFKTRVFILNREHDDDDDDDDMQCDVNNYLVLPPLNTKIKKGIPGDDFAQKQDPSEKDELDEETIIISWYCVCVNRTADKTFLKLDEYKIKKTGGNCTLDDTDQKSSTSSVLMETSPGSAKRPKKKVDDIVTISQDRVGIVRYIGEAHFFWGTVAGLELQKNSKGKNSGHIDKIKYFECKSSKELEIKTKQNKKKPTPNRSNSNINKSKNPGEKRKSEMTTRKDNADLLKDLNRKQDKLILREWPGKFKQKNETGKIGSFWS